MSEKISFIHAADLHLDSPFKGLASTPEAIFQEIRESTFIALDRLILAAIDRKVDFVLIVGDLFDNERQTLKAQIRLRRAFEELKKHHITVYLSYGNHDHINGNIHPVTYPDNVFIFTSEKVSQFMYKKNGQTVAAIHGFSYENRAVLGNKAQEYKITDHTIPYQIAMLHGSLQSNTEHDTYAPFQIRDLLEEDFDYWALGHIHQREILKNNPLIVYPGNTQGRNRKETGEKGCYHVVLSKTDAKISFVPLQSLQFNSLTIDVSLCNEIHQLENKIQDVIRNQEATTAQLIDLVLVSDNLRLNKWKNDYDLTEVIELVNETLINQSSWNYIFRLTVKTVANKLDKTLYQGDHFIGELSRQFEEKPIEIYLSELFKHRQGRKYLENLSKEEESKIKDDARQLLMNELLHTGGGYN